jgi:hypothetical protein
VILTHHFLASRLTRIALPESTRVLELLTPSRFERMTRIPSRSDQYSFAVLLIEMELPA